MTTIEIFCIVLMLVATLVLYALSRIDWSKAKFTMLGIVRSIKAQFGKLKRMMGI